MTPRAEALREVLDKHTCVPLLRDLGVSKEAEQAIRNQAVFLLAQAIVEELGITEEMIKSVHFCSGPCDHSVVSVLRTLLELAGAADGE